MSPCDVTGYKLAGYKFIPWTCRCKSR